VHFTGPRTINFVGRQRTALFDLMVDDIDAAHRDDAGGSPPPRSAAAGSTIHSRCPAPTAGPSRSTPRRPAANRS